MSFFFLAVYRPLKVCCFGLYSAPRLIVFEPSIQALGEVLLSFWSCSMYHRHLVSFWSWLYTIHALGSLSFWSFIQAPGSWSFSVVFCPSSDGL